MVTHHVGDLLEVEVLLNCEMFQLFVDVGGELQLLEFEVADLGFVSL